MVLVDHMVLDRRSVENQIPLFFCQILKWYICTDAKFPGNILHQRPHQCLPGQHRPFVDRQVFIRYQGRFIYHMDDARSVTMRTGSLAVKGKFLRQAVQQFCSGPKGGTDAGNCRTLVKRKGCGYIQYFIHIGFRCLRHTPSGIS